ncbi:outer membrane beta-barrel protein [Terasakiella sp. SH-1]|uniref:outer membrane beta-barrel protein n=1 Tax=Terasakiella sp. SH-1 TaxID=2560057 RepID=UPI00107366DF|nr:outer membrane beta-barrel protein [Terasakiella sp. SH-1]
MNKNRFLLGASLLVLATSASYADESLLPKDLYIGAGIGIPKFSGGEAESAAADAVIGSEGATLKAFVGYNINPHFAIEGGFISMGKGHDDDQFYDTFEAKAWELNALGRVPLTSQFTSYGKIGAAFVTSKLVDGGGDPGIDKKRSADLTVGLGLDYQMDENLTLRAAWDHYEEMAGIHGGTKATGVLNNDSVSLNLILHGDRPFEEVAPLGQGSDSGFYVGGGLAVADFDGRICDESDAGCENQNPENEAQDTEMTWQGFFGYQYNSYLAVEAGYRDLGQYMVYEDYPLDTIDLTMWNADLVGTLPVTERFALLGKAGLVKYSMTRTDMDQSNRRYKDNGYSYSVGLGASYQIDNQFSLRANYDFYPDLGNITKLADGLEPVGEASVSVLGLNLMYHISPMRREDVTPLQNVDNDGIYVAGTIGLSEYNGFEGASSDYDTGRDLSYQAIIGYQFNETYGIEAAYADLGKSVDDDNSNERAEAAVGSLSATYSIPMTERFVPFAKAGLTAWQVGREQDDAGANVVERDKGTGWTVGLGAKYALNESFGLRANWDFLPNLGRESGVNQSVDDSGKSDVHNISLGLYKQF